MSNDKKTAIDAKDLNESLDPIEVLEFIGYENSSPKISRNHVRDCCPIHRGGNPTSLSISQQKKCFKCHSCSAEGSLIDLYGLSVGLDLKGDFPKILEKLASLTNYHQDGMNFDSQTMQAFHRKNTPVKTEKGVAEDFSFLQEVWDRSKEDGDHPYLKKKKIENCPGVRFGKDEKGNDSIVVPYRDIDGELRGIQYINLDGKYWHKGSKTTGCFFGFGSVDENGDLYVAEGVATAMTVFEALGSLTAVLSVGSKVSIPSVVDALKGRYPNLKIIVALDIGAEDVMSKVNFPVKYYSPSFDGMEWEQGKDPNDFNDLVSVCGQSLTVVKEQLENITNDQTNSQYCFEKNSESQLGEYYQNLQPGIKIGFTIDTENDFELATGALTTLAAPTGHGKTLVSAAMTLEAVLRNDIQAMFFTLEERPEPIILRLLNCYCKMELSKNNTRSLEYFYRTKSDEYISKDVRDAFHKKRKEFFSNIVDSGKILIHAGYNSHQEMEKGMTELLKQHPKVKLVVIDYVQLMSCENRGNQSRTEEMKKVINTLRGLAINHGIAILQTAQFNREVSNEAELKRNHIAESSEIEKNSENIICMFNRTYKQSSQGNSDEIFFLFDKVRKGRHGQTVVKPFSGNQGVVTFGLFKEDHEEGF